MRIVGWCSISVLLTLTSLFYRHNCHQTVEARVHAVTYYAQPRYITQGHRTKGSKVSVDLQRMIAEQALSLVQELRS